MAYNAFMFDYSTIMFYRDGSQFDLTSDEMKRALQYQPTPG